MLPDLPAADRPADGMIRSPMEIPTDPSDARFTALVRGEPALVLEAVERAAEDWGAGWEEGVAGGRLELPVTAGLRHGRLSGRIDVSGEADASGEGRSRVVLLPERSRYRLWIPAVAVLLIAVAGGAVTVLWPFYPELLPLAPFGAILALSAWFLIVTRLQNRGAEEFLDLVAAHAGELLAGPESDRGSGAAAATEGADGITAPRGRL